MNGALAVAADIFYLPILVGAENEEVGSCAGGSGYEAGVAFEMFHHDFGDDDFVLGGFWFEVGWYDEMVGLHGEVIIDYGGVLKHE